MIKSLANKLKKNNKGFTLVELLVVIAIIGILGAVAVPTVFGNTDKAKASAVISDYNAVKTATLTYYNENSKDPAVIGDLNSHLDKTIGTDKAPFGGTYTLDVTSGVKLVLTVPSTLSDKAKEKITDSLGSKATIDTTNKIVTMKIK
jgi:prepilin-type N-terminal cleavage/methylation domain-containing protein